MVPSSKQKRVLLIAYHYLEQEDTASNRTRGILQYLPEYGWDLTLITKGNGKIDGDYPSNVVFASSFKIKCFNLFGPFWRKLKTPHKSTYEKSFNIERKSAIPFHSVWNTLHNFSNRLVKIDYFRRILEVTILFGRIICYYPDYGSGWYRSPLTCALNEIKKDSYQVILSTAAPINDHRIASRLKCITNLPWVADYRDLWAGNPYFEVVPWKKKRLYELEKSYLNNVNMLTVVSKGWEDELVRLHNKPVATILNGFDPEILNPGVALRKKFIITYAGALHNGKRNPKLLLQAIRELIDEKKIASSDIQVDFYTSFSSELQKMILEYDLLNCVFIHGLTSRDEILNLERSSQILLLLTWNNSQDTAVLPAKVFEYLAAKRPILSIGYEGTCAISGLLSHTQAGIHPLSYNELKEQLLQWHIEYTKFGEVQYHGDESNVMMYSQRGMAKKFAEVLDSVVLIHTNG